MINRISLVMPVDMVEELDGIRGDVPRSVYIRNLVNKAIENAKKGGKRK